MLEKHRNKTKSSRKKGLLSWHNIFYNTLSVSIGIAGLAIGLNSWISARKIERRTQVMWESLAMQIDSTQNQAVRDALLSLRSQLKLEFLGTKDVEQKISGFIVPTETVERLDSINLLIKIYLYLLCVGFIK